MLLPLLLLFLSGMLCGILTSLPIGPTNLWIARAALPPAKPTKHIVSFIVGLIFFDVFYAMLAFYGYAVWLQESTVASWAAFVGGVGLLAMGAHGFWTAHSELDESGVERSPGATHIFKDMWMGFFLGSNPAFIAYWVIIATLTIEYSPPELGMTALYVMFAGIVIGDIVWYTAFVAFMKRYLGEISPAIARWSRLGIATVFVGAGCLVLGSAVWKMSH